MIDDFWNSEEGKDYARRHHDQLHPPSKCRCGCEAENKRLQAKLEAEVDFQVRRAELSDATAAEAIRERRAAEAKLEAVRLEQQRDYAALRERAEAAEAKLQTSEDRLEESDRYGRATANELKRYREMLQAAEAKLEAVREYLESGHGRINVHPEARDKLLSFLAQEESE